MSTEDRRVVGFKVTNDEFNILQPYANEMYGFQVREHYHIYRILIMCLIYSKKG
jgi:hypothetical protein